MPRPLRRFAIMENVFRLENIYLGEDIWILAAGPTMDYVSPNFFDNKVSIGLNQVYRKYHTDFLLRKEADGVAASLETRIPTIVSRYDKGTYSAGLNPEADFVFDHLDNGRTKVDLSVIHEASRKIVVSFSTITSAIHVAAVMGAANIILCGHDCGMLDGKSRFDGYPQAPQGEHFYQNWLKKILPQTQAVRERVEKVYWTHVYSLNPFLGLRLEGHVVG